LQLGPKGDQFSKSRNAQFIMNLPKRQSETKAKEAAKSRNLDPVRTVDGWLSTKPKAKRKALANETEKKKSVKKPPAKKAVKPRGAGTKSGEIIELPSDPEDDSDVEIVGCERNSVAGAGKRQKPASDEDDDSEFEFD
jgi:hypothetical protein